jgi:hypothetical protein
MTKERRNLAGARGQASGNHKIDGLVGHRCASFQRALGNVEAGISRVRSGANRVSPPLAGLPHRKAGHLLCTHQSFSTLPICFAGTSYAAKPTAVPSSGTWRLQQIPTATPRDQSNAPDAAKFGSPPFKTYQRTGKHTFPSPAPRCSDRTGAATNLTQREIPLCRKFTGKPTQIYAGQRGQASFVPPLRDSRNYYSFSRRLGL